MVQGEPDMGLPWLPRAGAEEGQITAGPEEIKGDDGHALYPDWDGGGHNCSCSTEIILQLSVEDWL